MAERLYIQNRRKREEKKRRLRLAAKFVLLACGCLFFMFLLGRTVVKLVAPKQEATGEYVPLQEAGNLVWLLADTAAQNREEAGQDGQSFPQFTRPEQILESLKSMDSAEGDGYLTGRQAAELASFLPDAGEELLPKGKKKEKVDAGDWYGWFDGARSIYDRQGQIKDIPVTVLGAGADVQRSGGNRLSEGQLVTTEGEWNFFSPRFAQKDMTGRPLTAVGREDGLYAIRSLSAEEEFILDNIWIVQAKEQEIVCFWNDYEIRLRTFLPAEKERAAGLRAVVEEEKRDSVARIFFAGGRVCRVEYKENKISGRLLRVADGGAEIEGHGFFPFAEGLKIYRLYGRMKRLYTNDLCIGYAFTDFVLEDGEIAAALVPREEKMEYIRVLVKTSGFGSAYHDSITFSADCDCTISAFGGTESELAAGEELVISKDSPLFGDGERIWLKPDILTGHISLLNVERAQGVPAYRGSFELIRSPDGIVAVNEVLLEEYLYAVVPSEMPSSYPPEALKSQAVCARTYAYAKMCHAGLPAYGAHVDDSAGFQVYQNISETTETTKAVRETKGQTLFYGEELAEIYYYSTSCGYGADAGVWLNGNAEKYPYLVSQPIGEGDHFYEEEEPWYRWRYEVKALDTDVVNRAVLKRYEANADGVLTRQADGSFLSQKPPHTGRIREISVARYGSGGVAEQLLIVGEKATLLVKTEHNIRYVLCDGTTQVVRQDGSSVNAASMLPSAFFSMEAISENGFVTGYVLSGGGFGHGVGLSQNGAGNMAKAGMGAEKILGFFFKGCSLRTIY